MKSSTWLFVLGFFFPSCIKREMCDLLILDSDLMICAIDISACITGKQKEMDDHGKIIRETPCQKNFERAHALLIDLKRKLEGYPKVTKYPISESTLVEVNQVLSPLKKHIESLPDGPDKDQLIQAFNQLSE